MLRAAVRHAPQEYMGATCLFPVITLARPPGARRRGHGGGARQAGDPGQEATIAGPTWGGVGLSLITCWADARRSVLEMHPPLRAGEAPSAASGQECGRHHSSCDGNGGRHQLPLMATAPGSADPGGGRRAPLLKP